MPRTVQMYQNFLLKKKIRLSKRNESSKKGVQMMAGGWGDQTENQKADLIL